MKKQSLNTKPICYDRGGGSRFDMFANPHAANHVAHDIRDSIKPDVDIVPGQIIAGATFEVVNL